MLPLSYASNSHVASSAAVFHNDLDHKQGLLFSSTVMMSNQLRLLTSAHPSCTGPLTGVNALHRAKPGGWVEQPQHALP
jgi:hypothetical protein